MMDRIRDDRFRRVLIAALLAGGLCFSGFEVCLNHGHFCGDLVRITAVYQIGQEHSADSEPCEAGDTGDHRECSHSTENERHNYREGDPAVAGIQLQEQKTAPSAHAAEISTGVQESDRILPGETANSPSFSMLLSLHCTVILA